MGMPIPNRIQNAPELRLGLQLFFNAFAELDTEREGSGENSRIPLSAVRDWAVYNELGEDQRDDLLHHVRAMDAAYRQYMKGKSSG